MFRISVYFWLLFVTSGHSNLYANTVVNIEYDYFNQSLDVLNYINKIDLSTLPESLQRYHFQLLHEVDNYNAVGLRFSRENGVITRVVQPLSVSNRFDTTELFLKHKNQILYKIIDEFQLSFGYIRQRDIELECIERSSILLGGDCFDADFQLIDGDAYEASGEFRYLPVLSSSSESSYIKLEPSRYGFIGDLSVRYFANIALYNIKHRYDSALFAIRSDFLLDSTLNNTTLRQTIVELKNELPQLGSWQDIVMGLGTQLMYRTGSVKSLTTLRLMHSHKINYDKPSLYRNNIQFTTQIDYSITSDLVLYAKASAYLHYLQGIQPILYTDKSSRYFQHPYAELSLGVEYKF